MIMKQTIRLKEIYSADLFTRSMASSINGKISENINHVILDFSGIEFMSRSFTDELYNIFLGHPEIDFECINRNDIVMAIMEKVEEGRSKERQLGISHAKMYKCDDLESFSEYLSTGIAQ